VVAQACKSDLREIERVPLPSCPVLGSARAENESISQTICSEKECRGISPKWIGQIGLSNTILLDAASTKLSKSKTAA